MAADPGAARARTPRVRWVSRAPARQGQHRCPRSPRLARLGRPPPGRPRWQSRPMPTRPGPGLRPGYHRRQRQDPHLPARAMLARLGRHARRRVPLARPGARPPAAHSQAQPMHWAQPRHRWSRPGTVTQATPMTSSPTYPVTPRKQAGHSSITRRTYRDRHPSLPGGRMFNSAAEVLEYIKGNGVQFLDVRFCDLPGVMQHFTVPVESVSDRLFTDGLMFDGSSIRGFQAIHESDMLLLPDVT